MHFLHSKRLVRFRPRKGVQLLAQLFGRYTYFNGETFISAINTCLNIQTYEGAFGQNPDAEAHGGSTFCAVASLYLMKKLDQLGTERLDRLRRWCINRQTTGFSGRVNKPWDTCYSFWIGASLKVTNILRTYVLWLYLLSVYIYQYFIYFNCFNWSFLEKKENYY